MKRTSCLIIIAVSIFFLGTTYSQDKPEAPVTPEPPEYDFEFNFQNFPGMTEKDEEELLKNLNKDLREELKVIKDFNKQKYFEFLRESQFKSIKIPFIVKRERVLHELERKIFEAEVKTESLAAKYEMAKENDKRKIKEELRNELGKHYNQKEKRRKKVVEVLEKELAELKQSLEARQKNKKVIIERRLQELIDEEQYLDWD